MWFMCLWCNLLIKKGSTFPLCIATDFSEADSIEGMVEDSKELAIEMYDEIVSKTIKMRERKGIANMEMPTRLFLTLKVNTNPSVKQRFYVDMPGPIV